MGEINDRLIALSKKINWLNIQYIYTSILKGNWKVVEVENRILDYLIVLDHPYFGSYNVVIWKL